jgi:hypothetical protein
VARQDHYWTAVFPHGCDVFAHDLSRRRHSECCGPRAADGSAWEPAGARSAASTSPPHARRSRDWQVDCVPERQTWAAPRAGARSAGCRYRWPRTAAGVGIA